MRYLWLLLAGVFLASMSIPANAAAGNRHCAYRLEPLARHGSVVDARLVRIGCYASFARALEVGSGGTIKVSPTMTPKELRAADLAMADPNPLASNILIGTEYMDANYSSSSGSNSYFASSTCTASTTWQVSWVGASWNDVFSSGIGYGGCNTNKKYHDANFGGSVLTCTPDCTYYGSLNDQVSSLRWRT
jgi:hypothetical protein